MKNGRTISATAGFFAVVCACWMTMSISHQPAAYDANGLPSVDVYQLTMAAKALPAQQFDAF